MVKKYRLLEDATTNKTATKGSIVYSCEKYDYGLANDDTRLLGVKCVSVTFDENGDYPFFTVKQSILEEIND